MPYFLTCYHFYWEDVSKQRTLLTSFFFCSYWANILILVQHHQKLTQEFWQSMNDSAECPRCLSSCCFTCAHALYYALCDITKSSFELQNSIKQNEWQIDFLLYFVFISIYADFSCVYLFVALFVLCRVNKLVQIKVCAVYFISKLEKYK